MLSRFSRGVACKLGEFGAVEHILEPQAQVGPVVGVIDCDGAASNLESEADNVEVGLSVILGAERAHTVVLDGFQSEFVALAVAGVTVGREHHAQRPGGTVAADDVVHNQLLVEIFERRPDIEYRQRNIACGGNDAARGLRIGEWGLSARIASTTDSGQKVAKIHCSAVSSQYAILSKSEASPLTATTWFGIYLRRSVSLVISFIKSRV